jgi:NADH:ubiquinone oxidoreductase subunit K
VLGAGIILSAVGFMWMLLVRLSLIFPAAAAGHRVAPKRIWRLTRGNSLRLFLLLVVMPVGFNSVLQMGLSFGSRASSWRSIILIILGIYESLVCLAILAFSYRKLSDVALPGLNRVDGDNLLSDTARKKVYALSGVLSITIAGVIAWNAMLWIVPGEAVQIVRSNIPNRIETEPGMHFKLPFWEKSQPLPETHTFDMIDVCRTRNKQSLQIDFKIQWEIFDMAAFTRTAAGVRNAQTRIEEYFSGTLRNRIGTANPDQIDRLQKVDTAKLQEKDETDQDSPLYGLIEDVNGRVEVFGIEINSLQLKTVTVLK